MILLLSFFISPVLCSCNLLLHLYWPQVCRLYKIEEHHSKEYKDLQVGLETDDCYHRIVSLYLWIFHAVIHRRASTRSKQNHILHGHMRPGLGFLQRKYAYGYRIQIQQNGHVFKIWETVGNGMLIKKKIIIIFIYNCFIFFHTSLYLRYEKECSCKDEKKRLADYSLNYHRSSCSTCKGNKLNTETDNYQLK
jgi:hypothetical protein